MEKKIFVSFLFVLVVVCGLSAQTLQPGEFSLQPGEGIYAAVSRIGCDVGNASKIAAQNNLEVGRMRHILPTEVFEYDPVACKVPPTEEILSETKRILDEDRELAHAAKSVSRNAKLTGNGESGEKKTSAAPVPPAPPVKKIVDAPKVNAGAIPNPPALKNQSQLSADPADKDVPKSMDIKTALWGPDKPDEKKKLEEAKVALPPSPAPMTPPPAAKAGQCEVTLDSMKFSEVMNITVPSLQAQLDRAQKNLWLRAALVGTALTVLYGFLFLFFVLKVRKKRGDYRRRLDLRQERIDQLEGQVFSRNYASCKLSQDLLIVLGRLCAVIEVAPEPEAFKELEGRVQGFDAAAGAFDREAAEKNAQAILLITELLKEEALVESLNIRLAESEAERIQLVEELNEWEEMAAFRKVINLEVEGDVHLYELVDVKYVKSDGHWVGLYRHSRCGSRDLFTIVEESFSTEEIIKRENRKLSLHARETCSALRPSIVPDRELMAV